MIGAGDHHTPSGRGIVAAVELSGGKDDGEKSGHGHRPAQQDDGVRQSQSGRNGRHGARHVT